MRVSHFIKATGGAIALIAVTSVAGPSAAQAAPCYIEDPLYPGDLDYAIYYPECGEAGGGVSAIGSTLSGLGDSMVQQQLNFGGGMATFVTPTGKLRHSSHDGLRVKGTNLRTTAFETDEGSVFANGSYDLPGTYFGGKIRVSGLAGYDRLVQKADDGTFKTEIDAFIYGGSYLWSQGSFYSMSLIIGVSGEADAVNGAGSYSYDVSGYFTNSVIGYTFNMPGAWKFDLRGNLGHYDVSTSRFELPVNSGLFLKGASEAWNAGITGTIFTIIDVGGGVMRPYLLASYRNVFNEDIDVKGDFEASFEQANDFGKFEFGFDYVQGILTYGAAGYTEFSADENTFGARLGVSVKLQ